MPCPTCGDNCRCSSDAAEDSTLWRQEVATRLNRYQERRKPRPPRYPSLALRFDQDDATRAGNGASVEPEAFPRRIANTSNHALALAGFEVSSVDSVEIPASAALASAQTQLPEEMSLCSREAPQPSTAAQAHATAQATAQVTAQITAQVSAQVSAKIIEFPRSWTPPQAPLDQLAEPVFDLDRPRILEAPEVVPQPPALGGITIEPAHQPAVEKRPGIDIPLQSAPLTRRVLAAAIDGVIIAGAGALFGAIFWKLTAIRPPLIQIVGIAAGLASVLWATYQYLLVVYSGTTPGLRLAKLELTRFDGSRTGRRMRRWRVLASFLSAASVGMGYAWVFLDEDSLCWHDRITHTYLAPKK
jgi:hypothetical protein